MRFLLPLAIASLVFAGAIATTSATAAISTPPLRVAVGSSKMDLELDPKNAFADAANVQGAFLAPLYRVDAKGTLVPVLAAAAPVMSAGGTKMTVKLRATAKWSDGKPLTSLDVLTSIGRNTSNSMGAYYLGLLTNFSKFSNVTKHSFTLVFSKPSAAAMAVLTTPAFTPVPSHVITKYKASWIKPGKFVSSGPFVLKSATRTSLTGLRNPRYVGPKAKRAQIQFTTTSAAATIDTVRKFRGVALPSALDTAVRIKLDRDHRVTSVLKNETQFAYLNTTNSLLQKAGVRQAIAEALNRSAIAAHYVGAPAASVVSAASPLAPQIGSGARMLSASGAANSTDAAARLAAAGGWPAGSPLNVYFASDSDSNASTAADIKGSLEAIGIPVTLHAVSSNKLGTVGFGISPTSPGVDMVLQGWVADIPDASDYYQLFTCANVKVGLNSSNYCDATYDALHTDMTKAFTLPDRLAKFTALEDYLTGPNGAFPVVPLTTPKLSYASAAAVKGMNVNASNITAWERVG